MKYDQAQLNTIINSKEKNDKSTDQLSKSHSLSNIGAENLDNVSRSFWLFFLFELSIYEHDELTNVKKIRRNDTKLNGEH